jgi:apolipoprotein N-acyltransferase
MQFISRQKKANKLTLPTNSYGKDIRDIVLSSVLFILAYAPSPFGFLIYLAFVPQLYLYQRNDPLRSALYGYLIGLIVNSSVLYWLLLYAGSGFSVIVILNALQFAILGGVLSAVSLYFRNLYLIIFPLFWTFLEYIRQLGDLAFNWLNIAFTQTYYLYLIQFLDITGQSGVVFWICVINVVIFLVITKRSNLHQVYKLGMIGFLLFILPLLYGFYRMSEKPVTDGVSVSYIQPNVDLHVKWDKTLLRENLQVLLGMTDSLIVTKPQLVIWPETAIPYNIYNQKMDLSDLKSQIEFYNYHLITGAIDFSYDGQGERKYNASYFFIPGDPLIYKYHKLLLVPGEETFPLYNILPGWISRYENKPLSAGQEAILFKMKLIPYLVEYKGRDWQIINRADYEKEIRIASVICYESVFPNIVQRFYDKGSDLLIVITNDAWFDYTSQPFQHMQAVILRAIEQRTSVVRCANTGISAFVDPYGRRYLESAVFKKTSAQKVMPIFRTETLYSKFGDFVGIISGILTFSFLILQVLNTRWKNRSRYHQMILL